MPSNKKTTEEDKTVAKASQAVTLILGKNDQVFYYFGKAEGAQILETNYAIEGLRKILLEKNFDVAKQVADLKVEKVKVRMSEDVFQKRLGEIKANKNAKCNSFGHANKPHIFRLIGCPCFASHMST